MPNAIDPCVMNMCNWEVVSCGNSGPYAALRFLMG